MIDGRDHPAITPEDGPGANGDPMGTPGLDERVLWKGRPSVPVLTRSAFYLGTFAIYMGAMVVLAAAFGNIDSAIFLAIAGLFGGIVIQLIAWRSAKTTLYILTDVRLIMRVGMAVEARINIPLKHIQAAHLNMRGTEHGDIAVELGGERLLGYALLWPHVRPWHFARPQPMLRAVPEAETVARLLSEACAQHASQTNNLTNVKEVSGHSAKSELEGATA